jgi:hypothetical protein
MILAVILKLHLGAKRYSSDKTRNQFNTQVGSFVEIEICLGLLHIGSVALLKVLGEDDISVFTDSMHASFLTYSSNL